MTTLVWVGAASRGADPAPPTRAPPARVRLVVVIVVDQFRADYLTRFESLFGADGFLRPGFARFTQAYFRHGTTSTGPGHATISTGAPPSVHGIVGNEWYRRADGVRVYCVDDEHCAPLGPESSRQTAEQRRDEGAHGSSPANLIGTTLGDQLKLATGRRARVWGVALKDRAAVLLGGKLADGAIWWDSQTGAFVSSSYYFSELPGWLAQLNEQRIADRFYGARWERCLPESIYAQYARADDAPYERGPSVHLSNTFPKVIGGEQSRSETDDSRKVVLPPDYYEALSATPFANELVFDVVRRLIEAEDLGVARGNSAADGAAPDLVVIGLSANDAVGHLFGPFSHEVLDMAVRTDRQIGEFLNWLDRRVGLEHCLVAVTADHGAGLESEYAQELRLGGGRVEPKKLIEDVEAALTQRCGPAGGGRHYVLGLKAPWLYLDSVLMVEKEIAGPEAARVAASALAHLGSIPRPGIGAAYPGDLPYLREAALADPIAACALYSAYEGRSGDVYVHLAPFWAFSTQAAEHSSANSYDRHVPILLSGPGVKPARYSQEVDVCDLAVTLAALLEIEPPVNAAGRVLNQALLETAPR
ncbi:MAG TPA: alkaline phosphatase family protein [Phycisphaerae bacterium]